MKSCSICKEGKESTEFNRNNARKDGLQTHCKQCSKAKFITYYASNREKHRRVVTEKKLDIIGANQVRILEYLSNHSCVDCGESDTIVLEFDHVRGKKLRNVSHMLKAGCCWNTILSEIEKCDVRCANCHRRRTHKELQTYRAKYIRE